MWFSSLLSVSLLDFGYDILAKFHHVVFYFILNPQMNNKNENDIMEDSLNLVANLPLTVQHFLKEICIYEKQLTKYTKKINRNYKKMLRYSTPLKIKKIEKRIRRAIKGKIKAARLLQQTITTSRNAIRNKIYPIREELGLDIELYVPEPINKTPDIDSDLLYCVCNEKSYGDMICCDDSSCRIGWFHFACVGLKKAPKGKWFCEECKKKNNMKI